MHYNWFRRMAGFNDGSYAGTQARLQVEGSTL